MEATIARIERRPVADLTQIDRDEASRGCARPIKSDTMLESFWR